MRKKNGKKLKKGKEKNQKLQIIKENCR